MAIIAPQIKISQLQEATQSNLPGDPKNTWFVVVNAQTMSTKRVSLNSLMGYLAEFYADPNHQGFFTINTGGGITINNLTSKTVYSGNTITISDNTTISIARSGYNQANLAFNQANLAFAQANLVYRAANSAFNQANSAFNQANVAYDRANTAYSHGTDAYTRANNTYTSAGANSTFVKLSGGSMTGQLSAPALLYGSNTVLHAQNFNSYAPTKTGTGASGTWSISITGSAASAATLTGPLNSSQITNALGYTPSKIDGTNASGTWPISITGSAKSITGAYTGPLTSSQITSGLTYTPVKIDGTNASGTWPISITGSAASAANLTGTLKSSQITTGLGYTPANTSGTNASGTWPISITGSAASAANLTGTLTSSQITTGLGYTPPSLLGNGAYGTWPISITGSATSLSVPYGGTLTKPQITTALGYTPAKIDGTNVVPKSTWDINITGSSSSAGEANVTRPQIISLLGFEPPRPNGSGASGVWDISVQGTAKSITGSYTGPLTSSQITTALKYTPANTSGTNATGTWPISITGSAASAATLTGPLTSSQITTGLGYTPAKIDGSNATGTWNISVSGTAKSLSLPYDGTLTKPQITNALGYTPPTPLGVGASGTWPINVQGTANFAGAATTGRFFTTGDAGEGQLGASKPGYNPAYLFNNENAWGLYSDQTGGSIIYYDTSIGRTYLEGKLFTWYDPGGLPTHLWGGSGATNMYVYDINRIAQNISSSASTVNYGYAILNNVTKIQWGRTTIPNGTNATVNMSFGMIITAVFLTNKSVDRNIGLTAAFNATAFVGSFTIDNYGQAGDTQVSWLAIGR